MTPMTPMPRIHLRARRPEPCRRAVLLVAECTYSRDCDRAGEVVRGDTARELQWLDACVLDRVVDALQYRGEARAVDGGRVRVRYAASAGRLREG